MSNVLKLVISAQGNVIRRTIFENFGKSAALTHPIRLMT